MRIQVPIAKDTPIERIYEGAGYIHRAASKKRKQEMNGRHTRKR